MKVILHTLKFMVFVIAKSVVLTTLALGVAVLIKNIGLHLRPILEDYSSFVWWALGLTLLLVVLAQINRIYRSLRMIVTPPRVVVVAITTLLTYGVSLRSNLITEDSGQYSDAWGWAGTVLLAIFFISLLSVFKRHRQEQSSSLLLADDPRRDDIELTESQSIVRDRVALLVDSDIDTSIALTGGWGTGKTKIVHDIKSINSDKHIWFDFYPWAYHSEEALTKDFYSQLLKVIDQNLPQLSFSGRASLMAAIKRLTDGKVVNGLISSTLGFFTDMAGGGPEPDEIIANRLKNDTLSLVIVVDDLERVNDAAIINRTLQLVHHLRRRNVKGIKFITAFEKDAVIAALPEHARQDGGAFIEKFFDVEVMLPDPRPDDLWKQLIGTLPERMRPSYYNKPLLQDLRTHRAVIRLVNEYYLSGAVGTNGSDLNRIVSMDDFLVLGHIKLKYPILYKDISKNRGLYTQYLDGDGDTTLEWHFAEAKQQNEIREQHINNLCLKQGLDQESIILVKNLLADTFPEIANAINQSPSKSIDYNNMRKERKLGLRMVLDATLGIFDSMSRITLHETAANDTMKVIESSYSESDLQSACDKLIDYCVSVDGDGWDTALHIMTNELGERDEIRDAIPDIAKSLIKSAIRLGSEHDNGSKTRILGQAFYILVNLMFYRGKTEQEKQKIVDNLDLISLIKESATPFGSLLLARLDLSSDAREIGKYLTQNVQRQLMLETRRHFEKYYIEEEHDAIIDSPEILTYLDDGWRLVAGKYAKGIAIHQSWIQKLHNDHPAYFLDQYTTKTYRGNWAFKEDDYGTIRPVQHISDEQLKKVLSLVQSIEKSPILSEDDQRRIKMVLDYTKSKNIADDALVKPQ